MSETEEGVPEKGIFFRPKEPGALTCCGGLPATVEAFLDGEFLCVTCEAPGCQDRVMHLANEISEEKNALAKERQGDS